MNGEDRENNVTLELLQAIDRRDDVTQRHLADSLGIALGLANAYLKRCVRKGLVKVQQAPANRYLYYLTPKGFAEKSRLTAIYLRDSFDFYRRASASISRTLQQCEYSGVRTVALAGASELAEITLLRARESAVRVTSVYDPEHRADQFLGLPVLRKPHGLTRVDGVVVTAIDASESSCRTLAGAIAPARLFVPDLFGISGEVS
jgi:DNA-binding MarR family transcriptional regulator